MSHPRTMTPRVETVRLRDILTARMPDVVDRRRFVIERGVGFRILGKALHGQPLGAEAYLKLCAGLELDPVTLAAPARDAAPYRGEIHWPSFGVAIGVARNLACDDQRSAAKAAGVSVATLNRAEGGNPVSAGSLLRLAAYCALHPHTWSVAPDKAAA